MDWVAEGDSDVGRGAFCLGLCVVHGFLQRLFPDAFPGFVAQGEGHSLHVVCAVCDGGVYYFGGLGGVVGRNFEGVGGAVSYDFGFPGFPVEVAFLVDGESRGLYLVLRQAEVGKGVDDALSRVRVLAPGLFCGVLGCSDAEAANRYGLYGPNGKTNYGEEFESFLTLASPDMEAISKDYDGFHVTEKGQTDTRLTSLNLYGWDSESTLWFDWFFEDVEDCGEIDW